MEKDRLGKEIDKLRCMGASQLSLELLENIRDGVYIHKSELIDLVRKIQCRYNLECFNPENSEDCPELHCESKVAETIEKLSAT